MYQLVIRCDPLPGKLTELDEFLATHGKECTMAFGAKAVCVYEDAVVGYPEREIRIEFASLADLLNLLVSDEWKRDRETLLRLATNISSQIVVSRFCI